MTEFLISIYENRLKTYETVNMRKHEYLILQMFMPPIWYPLIATRFVIEETYKLSYRKLQYPNYIKDINPNVHMIRIFKKDIFKTNGEIVELDIINLFGFTFKDVIKDNILEWNENFVHDHPSCMFGKLE